MSYGTLTYHRMQTSRPCWGIKAAPHVMIRVKRVLPRVKPDRTGAVYVVDTPDVARDIQWLCDRYPLDMNERTAAHLAARVGQWHERQQAVDAILAGHPGGGLLGEPARTPRAYQTAAANLLAATGRLLLADDLGLGKAQPLDSPVLTPTGYRPMGELLVGDLVIAADGTPTRIAAVYKQGELDCYRVKFSDGATVDCNDEHLWLVRYYRRTRSKIDGGWCPTHWHTQTLRQLLARGLHTCIGQAKWHIPMMAAANLDAGGYRPLDPYLLGVLLGDGGLTGGSIQLTTADDEIVASVQATVKLRKYGHPLPPRRTHLHPVIDDLVDVGLWGHRGLDKFVPDAYKFAPPADRLALLQGLLDTDGYAMRLSSGTATAQFYSSSKALAVDVRWLAESLGGTGRLTSKLFRGRQRYTVTVKLPAPFNPFRLSRKAVLWGKGHAQLRPTRAITGVEYLGRTPMQCIAVDHPDQLYVTDRFVVTHNTTSALLGLSAPDALPVLVVTPTHLPNQWLAELALTWPTLRGYAVTKTAAYDLQAACNGQHPDVVVVNYAKLPGWADALAGQVKTVIFDEVQELRRGTSTFKGVAAARVADAATYVAGLSASPVYNWGGEIHNILSILSPDCLGSREEFLREWGAAESNGKVTVADPAALGTWLRDNGLMLRRTRRDVARELPEPVRIRQTVDADREAIDQLAGNAVDMARLVLDTAARQQQRWTAAGDLDWRLRQATGVAKAPYVAEFVRMLLESEDKVVLFGWHRVVYQVWAQRLAEYKPVLYTGSETPAQKHQAAQEFIHGDARVLMMSLRAGVGLDGLQKASSVAVFGELDWSPGVLDQCVGRLARDGQQAAVAAYFLVSDHGADPVMDEVLGLKRMQAEPIRDPDAPLLTPAASNADRVKLLAQAVIDRQDSRKGRAS